LGSAISHTLLQALASPPVFFNPSTTAIAAAMPPAVKKSGGLLNLL